jgi:hypothetical protein
MLSTNRAAAKQSTTGGDRAKAPINQRVKQGDRKDQGSIWAKDENDQISDFVREVGTAQTDSRLSKVILCHDMLVDWSRDIGNSDWKKSNDADWFTMLKCVCDGLAEAVATK